MEGADGTYGVERASSNDCVVADRRPIHDDGHHYDQDPILDRAAVQDHVVTNRHVVADDEWGGIVRDVQHAEVLDIRAAADANVVHVAANHCVKPDTGLLADHHIPDHDDRSLDKGGCGNGQLAALKRADHRPT